LLLLVSNIAFAQGEKETKFGIGFQSSFPAWGISGMMDVADNVSVQGILGVVGDLKTYAGRGIYRFRKEPNWNTYGYGMIGAWSYTGLEMYISDYSYGIPIYATRETTETVMGYGAGVGIEYDWRAWAPDLPSVRWNIEIGLGVVEFEIVDYDFSTFVFGCGGHYRF